MAKKILIIDDEKDMQVYLGTLFRKAGYEIQTAANGGRSCSWPRLPARPDHSTKLMPKGSGLRAYRGLRSSPKTRRVPIVVLTGLNRLDDFFGDLGDLPQPDAMVEKPIDRETFLETVERCWAVEGGRADAPPGGGSGVGRRRAEMAAAVAG
jgi:CheY-like chemotaxis protein